VPRYVGKDRRIADTNPADLAMRRYIPKASSSNVVCTYAQKERRNARR